MDQHAVASAPLAEESFVDLMERGRSRSPAGAARSARSVRAVRARFLEWGGGEATRTVCEVARNRPGAFVLSIDDDDKRQRSLAGRTPLFPFLIFGGSINAWRARARTTGCGRTHSTRSKPG